MIKTILTGPQSAYLEVRVGDSKEIEQNALCYYYEDTMPPGTTLKWTCDTPLNGRYVSVRKMKDNKKALVFCELKVFGGKMDEN